MTIAELRTMLETFPDDCEVFVLNEDEPTGPQLTVEGILSSDEGDPGANYVLLEGRVMKGT